MLYLHFFHSSGSPDIDDALFIVFSSWHVIDTMMIITGGIMRMQRPDGPSICETATECWVSVHQWCQHRTILGLNRSDPSSSSDWKGLSVIWNTLEFWFWVNMYFFAEKYLPCELSPPLGWVATVERLIAPLSPFTPSRLQEIPNLTGNIWINILLSDQTWCKGITGSAVLFDILHKVGAI